MQTSQDAESLKCPYMTAEQAAQYLGVKKQFLQRLRMTWEGPEFLKVSPRRILYAMEDLLRWLEAQRRRSTVDPGPSCSNR